jgi:hypothetical protein
MASFEDPVVKPEGVRKTLVLMLATLFLCPCSTLPKEHLTRVESESIIATARQKLNDAFPVFESEAKVRISKSPDLFE